MRAAKKGGASELAREILPQTRLEIAAAHRKQHQRQIAECVASDLAELRKTAGATLQEVAGALGYGRAWLNKLEMARNEISLADYLAVVGLLESFGSEHPGVKLTRYLNTRPRKPRLVTRDD